VRVEQILRHAEAVFAEVGFDQATTNTIARRAGISIGSLYQFFSSKERILEAMAERYLEQTRVALQDRLDREVEPDLDALANDMIALLIKLQERRPYFLQCLGTNRPSQVLARAVNDLNGAIAEHVVSLLQRLGVQGSQTELAMRARICVDTMSALLPYVVYAKGKERELATREIRQLMVRYISGMPGMVVHA
jgi:AcrR family transcriptional regulator